MTDGGGRLRAKQRQRAARGGRNNQHVKYRPLLKQQRGLDFGFIGGCVVASGLAVLCVATGLGIIPAAVGAVAGYIAGSKAVDVLAGVAHHTDSAPDKSSASIRDRNISGTAEAAASLADATCGQAFNGAVPRGESMANVTAMPVQPVTTRRNDR